MIVQMDHPWTFPHNRGTITINTRNYRNNNVQLLMYNYTIDGNVNNMVYTARSRISFFFSFFFFFIILTRFFPPFFFISYLFYSFFFFFFFSSPFLYPSHPRFHRTKESRVKTYFTWHNERKKKKMERLHSYI